MAIPQDHTSISTNLPGPHLEKVLRALDSGAANQVRDSHLIIAGTRTWQIEFEGAIYSITERFETVESVILEPSAPVAAI